MVRLYEDFREEDINTVKPKDVIVYPSKCTGEDNYLIVSSVEVDERKISGQIASSIGVNRVPLEHILGADNL